MEENSISGSSTPGSRLNAFETKEEYFARLEKAIKNIEEGRSISLSEEELDRYFEECK